MISTAYLAILLLPKLYATANQYGVTPRLNITSSGVDAHAKVAKDMLVDGKFIEWLNTEEKVRGQRSHYQVSKLLEVFVQELANYVKRRDNGQPKVIVNVICPGLCHSNLVRNLKDPKQVLFMTVYKAILARSTEVGLRTIVNAGEKNDFQTHGKYLANCEVSL